MFNNKVKTHTTGYSKDSDFVSSGMLSSSYAKGVEGNLYEKNKSIIMENCEYNARMNDSTDKVEEARVARRKQYVLIEQADKIGKDILMHDILYSIFKESLVLDDDFVENESDTLRAVLKEYVDDMGGYDYVAEVAKKSNSPLLKNMVAIVEKTSRINTLNNNKKVANNDNIDSFEFSLEKDEKSEFINKKNELSVEAVAEVVKDKVFSVVKAESDNEKRQSEIENDLNALAEDGYENAKIDKSPIEESSLFNGLFRQSYKQMVQEGSTDIDMDMVFGETIVKYTLMEMFHTIQLESYSRAKLGDMIGKMIR